MTSSHGLEGKQGATILNDYTAKIIVLKQDTGKNLYEIGKMLKDIKERKFYLPRFVCFEEYLEGECEIERRTAYNFIKFYETFDVQSVAQWGHAKLQLILAIQNNTDRENFMKVHKPTESVQTIKEEIHEFKKEAEPQKPKWETDYFWDLEHKGKSILNDLNIIRAKLLDFSCLLDGCKLRDGWNEYERKEQIIKLNQEIIKSKGNL